MSQSISFSKHAVFRAQQRKFSREVVLFVARCGDVRKLAKSGRHAVFVSEHLADTLVAQGFDVALLKKALGCCVVMAGKVIVTIHDGAEMSRSFLN